MKAGIALLSILALSLGTCLYANVSAEDMSGKRPESPIDVTTDKTDYYTGDVIKIEGHVPEITDGNEVNIIIKDANGKTFTKLRVKPVGNQFQAIFQIPPYSKLFPLGKWTINVSYAIWGAKTDINILGEKKPWYEVNISKPWFVILSSPTGPRVGHNIGIVAETTSVEQKDQQLTFIVQIKNDLGTTVFLKWLTKTLLANDTTRFSIIWIPESEGEYDIEVFAWDDMNDPIPLSPKQNQSLTVEQ
jgi:hypothetical protein